MLFRPLAEDSRILTLVLIKNPPSLCTNQNFDVKHFFHIADETEIVFDELEHDA